MVIKKAKKGQRLGSPKPPSFRNPPKGKSGQEAIQEFADFMDKWSGWNEIKKQRNAAEARKNEGE